MMSIFKDLELWLEKISAFDIPSWDQLPDIDLYSDQVLSFLEQKLQPYADSDDSFLTAYMINNYVKSGLINPPQNKKYNREHLAYLLVICLLKQIVSLRDIDCLLKIDERTNDTNDTIYNCFKEIHEQALQYVIKQVQNALTDLKEKVEEGNISQNDVQYEMSQLAFKMAIQAEVFKLVAHKIITLDGMNDDVLDTNSFGTSKPTKAVKRVAKKEAKQQQKKMKKEVRILKKQIK